jgi:hypothetical protein
MTVDALPVPRFRALAHDRYRLEIVDRATVFDLDRVRRERGALHGELVVSCGLPGTRSADGVLFAGNFGLSSIRDRKELAGHLTTRSQASDVDWLGNVEELCQGVIAAERTGQPAILLRDVPRPGPSEMFSVGGMPLLARHPMILFGDGGDAKSYLALWLAGQLAENGIRVLYVDWEFSADDHRDRLERLFGETMPDVLYARAERPMTAEADRLRRIVREENVGYIVADSVAFAADGPPEAAEVAAGYFRALRSLGVGSLSIAHTTKAENGDAKPFGSTFWHNGARSTWYVKRSAETGESAIAIGLFNRKANTGPLSRPLGYSIAFSEDRTTFERVDVADVADLAARLTVRQRMVGLLRAGAMSMVDIAAELDTEMNTVVQTVKRGEGKVFVRVPGPDGIYRIGLAERTAA